MNAEQQRTASTVWLALLKSVLLGGMEVSPRGKLTREILQCTIALNMNTPVVCVPGRKLNYRFMAAEAYWILTGDNTTAGIVPFNKHIEAFSDDGVTFFGAYGPPIVAQLPFVVAKLIEDPDSRQAVLTIWRQSPGPTKDTPCTVAMSFSLRAGKLNTHVFMRSNDIWLGTPYDVFNFSMVGHLVCAKLNESGHDFRLPRGHVEPGTLYVTAASSHLYQPNWEAADDLVDGDDWNAQQPTPKILYRSSKELLSTLHDLRTTNPGDPLRWWADV